MRCEEKRAKRRREERRREAAIDHAIDWAAKKKQAPLDCFPWAPPLSLCFLLARWIIPSRSPVGVERAHLSPSLPLFSRPTTVPIPSAPESKTGSERRREPRDRARWAFFFFLPDLATLPLSIIISFLKGEESQSPSLPPPRKRRMGRSAPSSGRLLLPQLVAGKGFGGRERRRERGWVGADAFILRSSMGLTATTQRAKGERAQAARREASSARAALSPSVGEGKKPCSYPSTFFFFSCVAIGQNASVPRLPALPRWSAGLESARAKRKKNVELTLLSVSFSSPSPPSSGAKQQQKLFSLSP